MGKLKITRFGGIFTPTTTEFNDLKILIEQFEDIYPGIDIWYKKKVLQGLKDKERTAYIIYEDKKPVGASISRLGKDAKICSLRILPQAEQNGYGRLLVALVARDMRIISQLTHFTIPDYIWDEKKEFFKEYGFKFAHNADAQYRLFGDELYCKAPFLKMWERVLETLPKSLQNIEINGIRLDYDLVMSIRPSYANDIVKGNKRVELRRKFSEKWVGSKTLIYSSRPERRFIGSFKIGKVISDHPERIWKTFKSEIRCPKEDFDNYTVGLDKVYAIIISESLEFKEPMLVTNLSHHVKSDIKVPQSYSRFRRDSIIEEAISVGALFQSTL